MKLQELFDKLNVLKASGKIVEWRVVRDDRNNNVVVINVGYPIEEDVVRYQNFAVRVYNRGTENEEVRWETVKPMFLRAESPFKQQASKKKQEILNRLSTEYNVIKVIGYTVDENNKYVTVTGFVDNGDGTVSRKSFVVFFDEQGNFMIYELRGGMT